MQKERLVIKWLQCHFKHFTCPLCMQKLFKTDQFEMHTAEISIKAKGDTSLSMRVCMTSSLCLNLGLPCMQLSWSSLDSPNLSHICGFPALRTQHSAEWGENGGGGKTPCPNMNREMSLASRGFKCNSFSKPIGRAEDTENRLNPKL